MSARKTVDEMPALITITEAAKVLGLSRASAYRYAAAGDLPVKRFGNSRVYVITAQLRSLIDGEAEDAA